MVDRTGKGSGEQVANDTTNVRSLFELTPKRIEALFRRAMLLDGEAATFADAERLYREVTRLSPKHWQAWNNLGVMLYKQGRKREARDAFGECLLIDPHCAETLNNIGTMFQAEGALDVAEIYLRKALRLDRDMPEARVGLAMVLQGKGQTKAAVVHWRFYLKRWPEGESAAMAREHLERCRRR
jgi:Flp pilus assembly protein TadD